MRTKSKRSSGPPDPAAYEEISKRFKDVNDFEFDGNVVLYGAAGTGKTTVAGTFPKPILFLDCSEKGTDSVRGYKKGQVQAIRVNDWNDLVMMYWYLKRTNKEKFKTVVIDTVSQLQDLAIKHWMEERGKQDKKKLDDDSDTAVIAKWGMFTKRDWGGVASLLKEQILNFRDLPMNVVFIAHERAFNFGDEEDDEERIDPSIGPRMMPSVASTLNAAVNWIGNTFIREKRRQVKLGKGKVREKKETEYCLRIGPHAYYVTKTRKPKRFKAPPVIVDPDYEKIVAISRGEDPD